MSKNGMNKTNEMKSGKNAAIRQNKNKNKNKNKYQLCYVI